MGLRLCPYLSLLVPEKRPPAYHVRWHLRLRGLSAEPGSGWTGPLVVRGGGSSVVAAGALIILLISCRPGRAAARPVAEATA